ncbi:hypothetical protein C8Q76DRAFT_593430, partial [Earliella scabrosa]
HRFTTMIDADAVLRTPDGESFFVHLVVLAQWSPVLKRIAALELEADEERSTSGYNANDLRVIPVQDDCWVMSRLLRFIYPGGEPLLGSIDIIQPLLRAAVKYQMDDVVKKVSSALLHVEADPLRISVAKSCKCEDIANVAARRTLKFAL